MVFGYFQKLFTAAREEFQHRYALHHFSCKIPSSRLNSNLGSIPVPSQKFQRWYRAYTSFTKLTPMRPETLLAQIRWLSWGSEQRLSDLSNINIFFHKEFLHFTALVSTVELVHIGYITLSGIIIQSLVCIYMSRNCRKLASPPAYILNTRYTVERHMRMKKWWKYKSPVLKSIIYSFCKKRNESYFFKVETPVDFTRKVWKSLRIYEKALEYLSPSHLIEFSWKIFINIVDEDTFSLFQLRSPSISINPTLSTSAARAAKAYLKAICWWQIEITGNIVYKYMWKSRIFLITSSTFSCIHIKWLPSDNKDPYLLFALCARENI